MKNLTLTALSLLTGWSVLACSSAADVAHRNDAPEATKSEVELSRSQVPAITNPEISDAEYATFIADANAFGLGLHQRLNQDLALTAKNGVFSPTSAQLALAMTYGAAVGETAAAMKTTLRDNLGPEKYHAASNRLQRELASRNYSRTDNQGYTWRIELLPANSLWADRTLSIKTPFLDLLSQHYDTGLWRVDFAGQPDPSRLAINGWVEDHPPARIKELLTPGDIDATTRFVLVNALYFFGHWAEVFDKKKTSPATFHTLSGADVSADTLHGTETHLPYKATGAFEVVQMPYTNGDLWMTLVLPAAGQFEAPRAQISGQWLAEATTGLSSTNVTVTLP